MNINAKTLNGTRKKNREIKLHVNPLINIAKIYFDFKEIAVKFTLNLMFYVALTFVLFSLGVSEHHFTDSSIRLLTSLAQSTMIFSIIKLLKLKL